MWVWGVALSLGLLVSLQPVMWVWGVALSLYLLVSLRPVVAAWWHYGRYHGPPLCGMRFNNGSTACREQCDLNRACRTFLPYHMQHALESLGVDTTSVQVCVPRPCTSSSCPSGYTCENHFGRRRCYRTACDSQNDCPQGTYCNGWPGQQKRCFPRPCDAFSTFPSRFDTCPQGFRCINLGQWGACYPWECYTPDDCRLPGSRCEWRWGGRRCVESGTCDSFMNRFHEFWHVED